MFLKAMFPLGQGAAGPRPIGLSLIAGWSSPSSSHHYMYVKTLNKLNKGFKRALSELVDSYFSLSSVSSGVEDGFGNVV